MTLLDKYGYPIERVKGRIFQNTLRYLLHTNIKRTYQKARIDRCRQVMLSEIDRVLHSAYELRLIDSRVLHILDDALKYGSSVHDTGYDNGA